MYSVPPELRSGVSRNIFCSIVPQQPCELMQENFAEGAEVRLASGYTLTVCVTHRSHHGASC